MFTSAVMWYIYEYWKLFIVLWGNYCDS